MIVLLLRAHWKFLKTVVNKLFEFMHGTCGAELVFVLELTLFDLEKHEGVQDMACDTFIKIAIKCKTMFVLKQMGEVMPFVEEILAHMPKTVMDLQPHQVCSLHVLACVVSDFCFFYQIHTFYEAIGHMIAAENNAALRNTLIEKLMSAPNHQWQAITSAAGAVLNHCPCCKLCSHVIRSP